MITKLSFTYEETLDVYQERYKKLKAAAFDALQSSVNNTMDEQEKALAIHDYLAKTITYDDDNVSINTIRHHTVLWCIKNAYVRDMPVRMNCC